MRRKERRYISRQAKKQLEIIEAKKKKMGINSEEVRIFKTYLWGHLYYIKKGWVIAPITIIGFMAIAFKYDGISVSVLWKKNRIISIGFRSRLNMKKILKLGAFKIYINQTRKKY